jgi:hypothetical protein
VNKLLTSGVYLNKSGRRPRDGVQNQNSGFAGADQRGGFGREIEGKIPMKKILKLCGVLIASAALAGCYTQVHMPVLSSSYSSSYPSTQGDGEVPARSDTFYVVIDTVYKDGDTLIDTTWYADPQSVPDSVAQNHAVRTVIVEPRDREYCIWTRDFLGYPELRCFPSYAEYQYYLSYSVPWWIRDRMYSYPYYGYPPNFYYDPYSGYYRYYRDFNRFYFPRNRGHGHFRRKDTDGTQYRRGRSYIPREGRSPQGGNAVQPGTGTTSHPEPGRRGRDYQGGAQSKSPPRDANVAPPHNQGGGNDGKRSGDGGGGGGSSQPRKNPRSQ